MTRSHTSVGLIAVAAVWMSAGARAGQLVFLGACALAMVLGMQRRR